MLACLDSTLEMSLAKSKLHNNNLCMNSSPANSGCISRICKLHSSRRQSGSSARLGANSGRSINMKSWMGKHLCGHSNNWWLVQANLEMHLKHKARNEMVYFSTGISAQRLGLAHNNSTCCFSGASK